jgi:predicted phage terminase large subunit-like protein
LAISRDEAARLLLEREAALSSYAAYCKMAVGRRGLKPAAHHTLLINAIDDVLTGAAPPRLLVIMPPGSAKSTYGSCLFPGYFFAKRPRGLLVGASHTQERADEFSLSAMDFARENQAELGYRIGGRSARGAARAWGTSGGGNYRAIGAGRKIAGQRMDFVFADDPVGRSEDVERREQRDKLWRWFWIDLRTRLRPGGRIVLMMTRWHEDDLAGRLLKVARPSEWGVLHIKAQAGEGDILGRQPGEMLWEDDPKYAYAKELRMIKAEHEASGQMAVWEALYQGNPITPGGNIFRVENIGIEDAEPAGFNWVRAWDLAASDGKGDFTAGLKLGMGPGRQLVIGDVVRLRGGPDEVVRVIRATAQRDGVRTMIALPQDPGQAGKAQIAFLTRELTGYNVKSSPESGDKVTRAMVAAAQANVGNISMVRNAGWNAALLDELASFPKGTYDDQVDALCRGVGELANVTRPVRHLTFDHLAR